VEAVHHLPAATQNSSPKENTEQTANTSTETSNEAQRNFLLGQVHNLLSRHLQYPLRARRRGWEGEVLLGFHVDHQGLLGNIHLARSSGYASLDRSAINALRKVKTIPLQQGDATLEAGFRPMDLQLPVIYQLHEG
jgi:protein TonB